MAKTSSPKAKQQKLALCIGINNYPGTGSDLNGCINDVSDWSAVLTERGFTVKKITNSAATRKAMMDAMSAIIGIANSGDTVVFQYSGHGSYVPDENGDEPDGTDECLVPYDVDTKGVITDDELFQIFDSRKKGVKLVFLSDSCHSGTVSRFAPITTPASTAGSKAPRRLVRFLPPATFLSTRDMNKLGWLRTARASFPPGRNACLLMSGCQDREYSYDAYFNDRPNGAFTFVALRALKKLKKDATYSQWYKEIMKMLPSQQYPQKPNLLGTTAMKRWKVFQ